MKNLVFVTTDVHFAATIRYELDADGDEDTLVFHELVSGPLNAGMGSLSKLDPTFQPVLLYTEGNLFNFAYVRIQPGPDGRPWLVADIRGEDGRPRPGSLLEVAPR